MSKRGKEQREREEKSVSGEQQRGRVLRRPPAPQHAQEQALASAVAGQQTGSYIYVYDVRLKSYFQQLPGLDSRSVGDPEVSGVGW